MQVHEITREGKTHLNRLVLLPICISQYAVVICYYRIKRRVFFFLKFQTKTQYCKTLGFNIYCHIRHGLQASLSSVSVQSYRPMRCL